VPKVVVKKAGKTVVKKLPYPSGKVGGYRAPVDTAGMDLEMKKTLGVVTQRKGKPRKGR
jgi:hypothetical protein